MSQLLALPPSIFSHMGFPVDPQTEQANARIACFYAAQGDPASAIGKKLGLKEQRVLEILSCDDCVALVIRLQTAMYPDVQHRIKRLGHMALDVKYKLLQQSTNESVRDKVATDLLDRSLGKATQVTENRNMNFDIKDVDALNRQLAAGSERLAKIETMKRALASSQPTTVGGPAQ